MYIKTMIKISEEDYNKLLKYSKDNLYAEIYEYVAEVANKSPFPPCGYGFNNPYFFEENGNHFVSWNRWGSCD